MAGIIFFFCLTAASYTRIAAQEQDLNQFPCYTNFIHYPNRALLSSKISTVQSAEVGECVLHCAKEKFCKSINFAIESEAATKTHRCELMKEDRYSKIEKFAVSSELDHYGPKVCSIWLNRKATCSFFINTNSIRKIFMSTN